MKKMLKKILVLIAMMVAVTATTGMATSQPAYAVRDESNCRYLLGMKSWDCMVDEEWNSETLTGNIWTIAANIFNDMTIIATYLALGFTVYGGYLYIFASGDVGKTQNGKKTLMRAFIGLAIVMLSNVIVNSIHIAFLGNSGAFSGNCVRDGGCISADTMVMNTLQWFVGIAGVIAFVYVVIGGIGYITSAGDPGKLQKAKLTIRYALVGLVIVALAEIMLGTVSNIIRGAGGEINTDTGYLNEEIIEKEIA